MKDELIALWKEQCVSKNHHDPYTFTTVVMDVTISSTEFLRVNTRGIEKYSQGQETISEELSESEYKELQDIFTALD